MNTRLNQKNSQFDWGKFIDAVNQTHGMGIPAPRYRDFVKVHVKAMSSAGMSWHVHTMSMGGMITNGFNFLSWHRWFVLQFEKRLQLVHPDITVPYWDAITDRKIPAPLANPTLLNQWGVTRQWDPSQLPSAGDLAAAMKATTFAFFQKTIEGPVHSGVHNAVGGDMATASSPTDPLFWLHHANLDRLWSQWQAKNPAQKPSNLTDKLQPKPMFGVTVASVQSISTLGYQYK